MSELDVISTPLGGSALTRAALAGETDPSWYEPTPHSPREWRERAVLVTGGASGDWLAKLTDALPTDSAGAERLARTVREGGVVVTTGQQPGLFGGPAYTWSKAISALELANELERITGIAVAPVFWAATDDADFAEAASTWIISNGELRALKIDQPPGAGDLSLKDLPLPDTSSQLAELSRAARSAAWPEAIEAARSCYASGTTIGDAYLTLLRRLLGPLGIAVLDAAHPAVRRAAEPSLRAALKHAGDVDSALSARADAIVRAGYEPQVAHVRGLSLVFESRGDGRRRVPIAESAERSLAALPGSLSPNVLLRPVIERVLLPTVAYVAGPSEIAYFAQTGAVAEALGAPRPLAVPRWSGTIVEPNVARALGRARLKMEDVRDLGSAESKVAERLMPSPVREAVERYEQAIAAVHAELRRSLMLEERTRIEPAVVDGFERDVARRTERLSRRLRAAVKRAGHESLADVRLAHDALFPHGKPQERVLNLLPMLARHGLALMDRMRERAAAHARSLAGATDAHEPLVAVREQRSSILP